ncbi:low affinity iron permease family protein [Streptomyces sp. TRM49041]|uniref:low affinity iron permease family protein n=1 Tax=Streptomyces sp. TRM49041 TaxID=2603216 RepID=UPI0011EFEEF4|nr:low affinity iron permease family protein [Streptomyces sp. TRM49041]
MTTHPAERGSSGRGRFERFAEAASNFTSSPPFFVICLAVVGAFIGVHAAGLPIEWLLLAGDGMAAVTLLLLALLKNSEMRVEHAVHRKLDAIAAAMLEMHDNPQTGAAKNLRDSIRMEEET